MDNLIRILTTDDAQVRIYPSCVTINAAACELLALSIGDRVAFKTKRECGMPVVYIGKSYSNVGARVKAQRGRKGGYIYSSAVSGALATALQGYGCYRICQETPVQDNGSTLFEIFFKKFPKG